jgi:hypothetical protein
MAFVDIPWPAFVPRADTGTQLDALNSDAIEVFLFPLPSATGLTDGDKPLKARKDRLRETMLRFHPDKFEGRVMNLVLESDREAVRDGVGRVVRAIGDLLKAESSTKL